MKKIFLLLLVTASLVSCKKDEFAISGKATGVTDGTSIFLQKQDSTGIVQVDTAKVKGGKFEFKGKIKEVGIHMIEIDKIPTGKALFILENGDINVDLRKDTVGKSKISGTISNDRLVEYMKESEKIQKKMMAFQNANMAKFQEAQQKQDTVVINSLMKQSQAFQNDFQKISEKEINGNPKSFLSLFLLQQFAYMPNKDDAKNKKMFASLGDELKKSKMGKKVGDMITPPAPKTTVTPPAGPGSAVAPTEPEKKKVTDLVGKAAPNFSATDTNGKIVALKESLGKLTIIDFWASWCGPCRAENPNVVAVYKEFHAKGLNIIGVSLDENANKWKEAIAKDGLVWTQISNLKGWEDPIAKNYFVDAIPATFLVDEKGIVIAKDLRGDELKAKIATILK